MACALVLSRSLGSLERWPEPRHTAGPVRPEPAMPHAPSGRSLSQGAAMPVETAQPPCRGAALHSEGAGQELATGQELAGAGAGYTGLAPELAWFRARIAVGRQHVTRGRAGRVAWRVQRTVISKRNTEGARDYRPI